MEPIEIAVEGIPIEQLRLCPDCYVVEWNDAKQLLARLNVHAHLDALGHDPVHWRDDFSVLEIEFGLFEGGLLSRG